MRRLLLVLLMTVAALAQTGLYPPEMADEGLIGILFGDAVPRGSLVKEVRPGGAADQAGVKAGDLITSIAGTSVAGLTSTQALAVCRKPAGTHAQIAALRSDQPLTFELTWAPVPPEAVTELESQVKGPKGLQLEGWVELVEGNRLGILLAGPGGHVYQPGVTLVIIPTAPDPQAPITVYGQAKVTRLVSLFRIEAEVTQGGQVQQWQRVVVVNPP